MSASAHIPRKKVLTICDWTLTKIDEMRLEKDAAFLQRQAKRRNWWRRLFRLTPLSNDRIHGQLLETDYLGFRKHDYPWHCPWERDFRELAALAKDATGAVRVGARDWYNMLGWYDRNGSLHDLRKKTLGRGNDAIYVEGS